MIKINGLSKKFGTVEVLHEITRSFEKGKIHGVVGNNGSGKTVLFKCICGFMKPTTGTVCVNGKIIGKDVDFPSDIGIIIETPGFIPYYSGIKNLQILAAINNKINNQQIIQTLKTVGLDEKLKRPVSKYSLGMRQRLGIAQAIMEDPEVLILDEPFNGLDKDGVAQIRNLILSLKERGKTIILASHNKEDIDILCDTVWEMDAGVLTLLREGNEIQ